MGSIPGKWSSAERGTKYRSGIYRTSTRLGLQETPDRVHVPCVGMAGSGGLFRCLSVDRGERVRGYANHGAEHRRARLPQRLSCGLSRILHRVDRGFAWYTFHVTRRLRKRLAEIGIQAGRSGSRCVTVFSRVGSPRPGWPALESSTTPPGRPSSVCPAIMLSSCMTAGTSALGDLPIYMRDKSPFSEESPCSTVNRAYRFFGLPA